MRKMSLLLVCLCVMCTPFTINAQEMEVTENGKVVEVPVKAVISSTFTVKLPTSISLSNVSGKYSYAGQVGVKGDLMSGASIEVLTATEMTMYDVTLRNTNDVPSDVNDQSYPHKDACTANVNLSQTLFDAVSPNSYKTASLSLLAENMSAGKWKGNLIFNIKYNKPDRSGLYNENGVRVATWQELVNEGTIHCTNGTIYTNHDGVNSNASSDRLEGRLVLPDDIIEIEDYGFAECDKLISISLPDGIEHLHEASFFGCDSLESMHMPDSITQVGEHAFEKCVSLREVSLSRQMTFLRQRVFAYCYNLRNLEIPSNITDIDDYAFRKSGIIELVIPSTVTTIHPNAFNGVNHIISNNDNIPAWVVSLNGYVEDGFVYTDNTKKELQTYVGPDEVVVIPEGVEIIDDDAFKYDYNITSIIIPDSVYKIRKEAFKECPNVLEITIPNTVTTIQTDAFKDIPHIIYEGTADGAPWGALSMN